MPRSLISQIIARRYLRTKRNEAFITIITYISLVGVALGVAILNIVMSIMTGFEVELKNRLVGTNSHIVVRSLGGIVHDWQDVRATIGELPDVISVSPFTYSQGLIRANGQSTGVLLRGIQVESAGGEQLASFLPDSSKISLLDNPPTVEVFDKEQQQPRKVDLPALIIGDELSRSLGISTGDTVSVLAPNVQSTPFGLVPRFRRFVVVGRYSSGLVEYESAIAYASLPVAQQFFRLGDGVSGLEVRVKDINKAPEVSSKIMGVLSESQVGLYAQDWTESNRALWEAIRLEKSAYFIILLLLVVLASFSIVTTLIMIVLEKRKDIAILRTLGASAREISGIFRYQGAIIGGFGTLAGTLLGVLGCLALEKYGFPLPEKIFPVDTLPVQMNWLSFLLVAVCSFVICYLATLYPALRASKLNPSEILRYE